MNLNPNILLTEACNQGCAYCFARKKMAEALKKEMPFEDFKKVVSFIKKSGQREIRLMGGEPTLHSRFKEAVDFIIKNGLKINIFTNGLFSESLAGWLGAKGDLINYNVNFTTPALKLEANRKILSRNLKIIGTQKVCASVNVDRLDFTYDPLVEFIKYNGITSVRLGAANSLVGDPNWLDFSQFKDLGRLIFSFAGKLGEAGVEKIYLNCVTPCMFSKLQLASLAEKKIRIIGWECGGKKGAFEISTDLSIFLCFVLEEFKAGNLLDFKDLPAAKKFIDRLLLYGSGDLFKFSPCKECAHFKASECKLPCRGWAVNQSGSQTSFYNLRKTIYFKMVYRILYLFRNHI